MSLDPTVWVGIIGGASTVAGTVIAWAAGRRRVAAEADRARAQAEAVIMTAVTKATAAVQDAWEETHAHMEAQVRAARAEAASAREEARQSREASQAAEADAWSADMRARRMERLLAELRPLIAQYVPGAEPILDRIDLVTAAAR